MKLISFLGTGNPTNQFQYFPAQYRWEDRPVIETAFFPDALLQWLPDIDQVLVMLTDEVRNQPPKNTNWLNFKALMIEQGRYSESGPSQIVPVDIKTGKNEAEIWEMFDTLVQHLQDGDEIILDITHAFRSLPVLSLIAAIFMRSADKIKIRHILYGAFEGKDKEGITPVYDLSPFIDLLDWSQAANQLIETGISRNIGHTLKKTQDKLRKEYYTSHHRSESLQPPSFLGDMGKQLEHISNTLLLSQPRALAQAVKGMEQTIAQAQDEANMFVKPFNLVQQRLLHSYQRYDHFGLESMLDLLDWYCERHHYVQAITLAREWLVCLLAGHLLGDCDPPKGQRDEIEKLASAMAKESQGVHADWVRATLQSHAAVIEDKIPFKKEFVMAWSRIADLRNDIAHCYMGRRDDKGAPLQPNTAKMIKRMQQMIQDEQLLRKLPLPVSR